MSDTDKKVLTIVAGTKVGIVSKYPRVDVYDRSKKYTAKNKAPNTVAKPPQAQHQNTYFLIPPLFGLAETKEKRDQT